MTSSHGEGSFSNQQALPIPDNDASAAIEWSAPIPDGTQFYDAELNQSQDRLLLAGFQPGATGIAYEIDLDGTILRSQPLTTFRGTDVIAGPDQENWHAGGSEVNGNPNGVATLAWNHLSNSGTNIAVLASTGSAYHIVDGFNFGGKILDLYANYSLAPHQLDVRIDGELFASGPLDLTPLAAAWNSGDKELYVVGWPNTGTRTSFELYKTDLNNHFWPTGSPIPWTQLGSFTGPSLGTAPSGAPWSEAYIDSLLWDEASESLLFSGSSAVYDDFGNPANAGFVGSYSPLSGITDDIVFPLGNDGGGISTDAVSDVIALDQNYLLAGGNQTVSSFNNGTGEVHSKLWLIDRNTWSISSRSFDQLQFDSIRDLTLDNNGGIYTTGSAVNYFSDIAGLFNIELDLSKPSGAVITPSQTQYDQLQGHQELSPSQLNEWGSYQLELNSGKETFGSRDIYLLPYATAAAFHGGSTPAAYWGMNMGAVDENDIILIDSQVDLNQVAQFADCIWFDANYTDRPLIDTRGLISFQNYNFYSHPDNFEMAYYDPAGHAPVPAQFGQIDFSQLNLDAIALMSSDEFLIHYGDLITSLPNTGGLAYSIKATSTSINEGQSLQLDVATEQQAGNTIYWGIHGTGFNSDDLSSGVLEGSQLLDGTGNFSINLNLAADLSTEGSEEIELRLYNDPGRHNRVATSASITINDTSTAPIPTFNASTSNTTIHEGFELLTSLNTQHVAPGTQIWWELDSANLYSAELSQGSLSGSSSIDANGQLQLSHVFTPNANTNARIHFYSDAARSQRLASTASFQIKPVNYTLQVANPADQAITEVGSSRFNASLPTSLAAETIHWSLSLDDTNADDWSSPLEGSSLVGGDGSWSLELSPTADLSTEGGEFFQLQLFSDADRTHPLQSTQTFKLIDTSHAPFQGFPYADHLFAQFSSTFSADTNPWNVEIDGSDFYDAIWDRWSGTITGSNQRELIWHAYSTRTDDRLIATGGDGQDHFLGCADRSLEERQPNQPAVGPIRGDANDGYLWIQDFDPSEDLLIFPFNSDQPVQFDGTYLSITTPSGATDRIFQLNDGGFSFQDIRGSLAFLDTISNGAIPTYSLNPSSTTPNEGETLTTTVTTSGLQPGTTLYWSLKGALSPDDLESGALQGSATLDANGGFSIDHQFRDDLTTEGAETFTLELFQSPERDRILASSNLITLGDTSITSPTQTVQFSANQIPYQPGAGLELPLLYSTNTADQNLTGLTLNVHFDASRLTPTNTNGVLEQLPATITSQRIVEDQADLDDDPLTSHFIELIWADFNGTFPGQPLPAVIATLGFHTAPTTSDPITGEDPSTTVRTTASETAPNYSFLNSSTELRPQHFHLDVDGDGSVTALGDGLMVIRKLFGNAFAGDALTNKAVANNASRSTAEIHSFLEEGISAGRLDIDHDGQTTALGDGLMIIRHLFGNAFSGSALTNKAISNTSEYYGLIDAPDQISANIDALIPALSNQT